MVMSNVMEDEFGFVPEKWSLEFDNYEIFPIEDYDKYAKLIDEYTHRDKFYYPPLTHQVNIDIKTQKPLDKIPKTERPASLYQLHPSHIIKIKNTTESLEQLRKGATGFVIHLLAYLFGRRFQFCDWWYESRVPMDNHHNVFLYEGEAQEFMQHSFAQWKTWAPDKQQYFTNLLFMHSRTMSYQWDWERFMMEYIIFDGCWKFYSNGKIKCTHQERLRRILSDLGMKIDNTGIDTIIRLRNDLFHEALWDKGQPCSGGSSEAFYAYYHLRRINQRIIVALLKYQTRYICTDWKSMGTFKFKM